MRLGGMLATVGGVVAVGAVGVAVGYAVTQAPAPSPGGQSPVAFRDPAPMSAKPQLPIDPPPSYAADPDYPPLAATLDYVERSFRSGPYVWHYEVPAGWVGVKSFGANHTPQITWKPPAESQPGSAPGGYQVRVAPVAGHFTKSQMIVSKTQGLLESATNPYGVSDLVTLNTTSDSVWYEFRDNASSRHRFNDFAWVDGSADEEWVGFEVSVSGRSVDQAGLTAMLEHVRESAFRTAFHPPAH